MNQSPQLPNPARVVRILHVALLAGVIMLWAVAEAAALVSLVGYVITGAWSPAAAAALAIVALFVFRPARLEAD